ncbi:MAG: aquaporin [Saprospirales bacterium]|jgi:aquaporin Z|nr:aquaporin [Saprospirales bacterium]MBK8922863.1 aquaporin [Saprospirales bacterium]
MKKYFLEGIGTFMLVLILVLVSQNGVNNIAPWVYGAALAAFIFAAGAVSAVHLNPALSLAHLITGKIERWDAPYALLAQLAGGVLAAMIASFLIRCQASGEVAMRQFDPLCALFAEALGTFFLSLIFLLADQSKDTTRLGLAAGFTVMACAAAFQHLCGATFNPVIAAGMAISGLLTWADTWICLAGTFLGAAAGASVFRAIFEVRI